MHGIVCTKGAEFVQVQKEILYFCLFFRRSDLIPNRFQCVIYQMKENKFLIKFMIYYFWVGVIPFELWSNEFTVKLLFLHTVYYWYTTIQPCFGILYLVGNDVSNITTFTLTCAQSKFKIESQISNNNGKAFSNNNRTRK